MAQLKPPGTGLLFVALYDTQGYNGGILTHLHTGFLIHHNLLFSIIRLFDGTYYEILSINK
jgi:hypothetical protein